MTTSLFQKSQSAPLVHLICLVIALGQLIDVEGEQGEKIQCLVWKQTQV